jgi:hypothetical protein
MFNPRGSPASRCCWSPSCFPSRGWENGAASCSYSGKSIANEAEHEEKEDRRRQAKRGAREKEAVVAGAEDESSDGEADEESEGEIVGDDESDDEAQSMATGSFVKVKPQKEKEGDVVPDEDENEPDFYDINAISWDIPCSALHFAIVEGHEGVVKTLCQVSAP